MTTLATITAVIAVFAVVQVQEWRELTRSREWGNRLTRNNRYAVKLKHHNDVMLSKARANERVVK